MKAKVLIKDIFRIRGIGIVVVGIPKEGLLKPGMKLNVKDKIMTIKSIKKNRQSVTTGYPGDEVGINLRNGNYELIKFVKGQIVTFYSRGSGESKLSEKPQSNRAKGAFSFIKKLFK